MEGPDEPKSPGGGRPQSLLKLLDRRAFGGGGMGTPQRFNRTVASSAHLLRRLERQRVLEGHAGCVNTVSWTPAGDVLLSGSDDQQIILWDWCSGSQRFSYYSGHRGNVFQARAMPESAGRTIVSCAADGQVRVGQLPEGGGEVETRRLSQHRMRAHKLATAPGSPHCLVSCGEDAVVMRYDLRAPERPTLTFKCKNAAGNVVGLNAIVYHPNDGGHTVAVAGADPSVLVYDLRRIDPGLRNHPAPTRVLSPEHIRDDANAHLTCVQYSHNGELLGTYSAEGIYLFAPEGQRRPSSAGPLDDEVLQVYKGHLNSETVKGVSFFGSSDEYVISGSDCGRIFFWNKADASVQQMVMGDNYIVNSLAPHPSQPLVLATSGIEHAVKLWGPTASQETFDAEDAMQVVASNIQAVEDSTMASSVALTPEMMELLFRRHRRQMQRYQEHLASGGSRRRRGRAAEREEGEEPTGSAVTSGDEGADRRARRRQRRDPESESGRLDAGEEEIEGLGGAEGEGEGDDSSDGDVEGTSGGSGAGSGSDEESEDESGGEDSDDSDLSQSDLDRLDRLGANLAEMAPPDSDCRVQ